MDKKSAVSRKPSSQDLEDFIGKGLQTSEVVSTKKEAQKEQVARVQLRIPKTKVEEIDQALNQRKVKVSRHVWLLEAIEEKLEREAQNAS